MEITLIPVEQPESSDAELAALSDDAELDPSLAENQDDAEEEPDSDADTDEPSTDDWRARQSWLQARVDSGEATTAQKQELGRINQSSRDQEQLQSRLRSEREARAKKRTDLTTSLPDKFMEVAGVEADDSAEYQLARIRFKELADQIIADSDSVVNASRELTLRNSITRVLGNTPDAQSYANSLSDYDQVLEAAIQLSYEAGLREANNTDELKKLRAENTKLKSQIEDRKDGRTKGVSPVTGDKVTNTTKLTKEVFLKMSKADQAKAWAEHPEEVRAL